MALRVGVVGTGGDPENPEPGGYAMGYRHGWGYRRLDDCDLVACADLVRTNAAGFADRFGLDDDAAYTDHEAMLDDRSLDIVSVCTPPGAHADVVVDCASSGVAAVHCEKPMATTWGDCRRMVDICEGAGVQLTFNHQRRFATPVIRARELLDEGAIGDLCRIELGGRDLFDYGTHLFDLCGFFTDQATAEWVLAAIDYAHENRVYGVHCETRAVVRWAYRNGIAGVAATGDGRLAEVELRLLGSDGTIEIGRLNGPPLRIRRDGETGWRNVDTADETFHGIDSRSLRGIRGRVARAIPSRAVRSLAPTSYTERAVADVVRAARSGQQTGLRAGNALDATELIFASWESARRRGRVDLPLDIDDNPLEAMIESGELGPPNATKGPTSG